MWTFLIQYVLKTLFRVIIVYSYIKSADSVQIISEALAKMMTQKYWELSKKYFNLFLMRPPKSSNPTKETTKMTILEIFKYNLEQLNIKVNFSFFLFFNFFKWLRIFGIAGHDDHLVSRNEKIQELKNFKEKVISEKKLTLEKFREDKFKKFHSYLKEMFFLAIYILILVLMVEKEFDQYNELSALTYILNNQSITDYTYIYANVLIDKFELNEVKNMDVYHKKVKEPLMFKEEILNFFFKVFFLPKILLI